MERIFRKDDEKLFFRKWQEYIDDNVVSYEYLPVCLDYKIYCSMKLHSDESFVVIQNNKSVAICFLPIEKDDNCYGITLSGGYTVSPLAISEKIEKEVYLYIDDIAEQNSVGVIKFHLSPLIMEYRNKFNSLLKYGYIDSSSTNGILELNKDKRALWSALSKGHKADIKKVLRNNDFELVTIDSSNANYDIHEIYRELHHKCAGRVTRVKESFDKQFAMLKDDNASMFGLRYREKYIGFSYFLHHAKTVVYASGSDDPDYDKFPIYHTLIWIAMNYYQQRGFVFMELGQPCGYRSVNGFDDYLDQKQINISHFKRGLGSKMVPLFRGIKYFDKNQALKDLEEFKGRTLKPLKY